MSLCDRHINNLNLVIQGQDEEISGLEQALRLEREARENEGQLAWYKDAGIVSPLAFALGIALGAWAVGGRR